MLFVVADISTAIDHYIFCPTTARATSFCNHGHAYLGHAPKRQVVSKAVHQDMEEFRILSSTVIVEIFVDFRPTKMPNLFRTCALHARRNYIAQTS